MHTIKITPNLLFEYQCTSGKFIRLPNRIESNRNFFCPNWNALLCGRTTHQGTGGAAAWRRRHHVGRLTSVIVTLRPDTTAEYYDERVCVSVCVCVCACPRSHLRKYTSDHHQFSVHVIYGRGSVLLRRRTDTSVVMYFRFYGRRHICSSPPSCRCRST